MPEELKLLSCPFCGGDAEILEEHRASFVGRCIYAGCCDAGPRAFTKEEAIKAWNTRVQPAVPSVEEIERELNHTWYKFWRRMVDIPPTIKEQAIAIHALMKGEK